MEQQYKVNSLHQPLRFWARTLSTHSLFDQTSLQQALSKTPIPTKTLVESD
jgi:hypothetical protein